jgi:hypothetical protein
MKRLITLIAVLAFFAIGTSAFAAASTSSCGCEADKPVQVQQQEDLSMRP